MAKFDFIGISELVAQYKRMGNETDEMIKRAVYEGAKVVADATKKALEGLPVDNTKFIPGGYRSSITSIQKAGLIHSMGVSHMENDNGYVNVKIGVSGYNKVVTDYARYKGKGQPNALVARALEAGTSYMPKNPVFTKTAKAMKQACEQAMQDSLDRDYKAIK